MIIELPKSVIPACDVGAELYESLVKQTSDLPFIGGYKLGFELALTIGLPRAVDIARKYTDKPLIYDHQKGGTDIPDMGKSFAKVVKGAGIKAMIIFPHAGPETERAWIEAAREVDLGVIVGGLMTHRGYVRSEGGYIADDAVIEMYTRATALGVDDYVVAGNNPEAIAKIKAMLERERERPVLYSPGFITQGGQIAETARVAGERFHAIVGRAIHRAADMRAVAQELCRQLTGS